MTMRRKERQVSDDNEINAVIEQCDCIRLGLTDDEGVYIVPLSFGYLAQGSADEGGGASTGGTHRVFYFHGARQGRKARCMEAAEKSKTLVTFEMDTAHGIKTGDTACKHSAYYKCVMGRGTITRMEDNGEKRSAFNLIMAHNVKGAEGKRRCIEPVKTWSIPDLQIERVAMWKLEVTEISCKENNRE